MPTDPLTLVHDAFWILLEANSAITSAVPTTNRLKLDAEASPEVPPDLTVFDEPTLRVRPVQGVGGFLVTSSSSNVRQTWLIEFAVGERHVDVFYPLYWAILCAMSNWEETLQVLQWDGAEVAADKYFVKDCKVAAISENWTKRGPPTRQHGWFAVMACEVSMWFKTSDMQA